jgi:Ser/Thr protein kinase RdoA (MazF antagonist)
MLPVQSTRGQLVEEISSEDGLLFGCVFEHAAGEKYDSASCRKQHLMLCGRTLGLIHALSKAYVQSGPSRRYVWSDDELLLQVDQVLPSSETVVWRAYSELKERLQHYPISTSTYGLIHGDFGGTNYRYWNKQLNIFDFDDCCYHWFIYDLAVSIYPQGGRENGMQLLDWLLEGYSENMSLKVTLREVTMFCQWRLLYMFLVYARKWGFKNLSEQQVEWFAWKRENIGRGYKWGS